MSEMSLRVFPAEANGGIVQMQQIVKDNLPTLRYIRIFLEAKPLYTILAVAVENFFGKKESCLKELTSRLSYIEAGLISAASFIYNFTIASVATGLELITLGQIEEFHHAFKKHWLHTAVAVCSIVVSLLGFIYPVVGAVSTLALLTYIGKLIKDAWIKLQIPNNEEKMRIIREVYDGSRSDIGQVFTQLIAESERVGGVMDKIDKVFREADSLESLALNGLLALIRIPENPSEENVS